MPAPVSSIVLLACLGVLRSDEDCGAERNSKSAFVAPIGLLALRGMMMGGGRPFVRGILNRGRLDMRMYHQ